MTRLAVFTGVAGEVAFLASNGGSYPHDAVLMVDGGVTA